MRLKRTFAVCAIAVVDYLLEVVGYRSGVKTQVIDWFETKRHNPAPGTFAVFSDEDFNITFTGVFEDGYIQYNAFRRTQLLGGNNPLPSVLAHWAPIPKPKNKKRR